MTVTVDGYTRFILTAIAVLLGVVAVGLWFEAPSPVPAAWAGAAPQMNPGQQLDQIARNTEQFNLSMDQLQKLLVSGSVKVQVVEPIKKEPIKDTPATPVKHDEE